MARHKHGSNRAIAAAVAAAPVIQAVGAAVLREVQEEEQVQQQQQGVQQQPRRSKSRVLQVLAILVPVISALAAYIPGPSKPAINPVALTEKLGDAATGVRISNKSVHEVADLLGRLPFELWEEDYDFDEMTFPMELLDKVLERMEGIDQKVKSSLSMLDIVPKMGLQLNRFQQTDQNGVVAKHGLVAAYHDGTNISIMYIVYKVSAKLHKSGWFSSDVQLTPKDKDLIMNTFVPHRMLQELKRRSIIDEIAYVD